MKIFNRDPKPRDLSVNKIAAQVDVLMHSIRRAKISIVQRLAEIEELQEVCPHLIDPGLSGGHTVCLTCRKILPVGYAEGWVRLMSEDPQAAEGPL
tara:strand:- start:89 stop:376 length:288 start_codon:yes stop_codon:yes gene_type:complete